MKGPKLSFLLPRCSLSRGGEAPSANSNGGDASRVGFFSSLVSRKRCCYYLVEFVFSYFLYPDARRVAPIRGSVWSTNTQNAGKIKALYKVFSFARNNHYNNYTSCKTRCKNTYAYYLKIRMAILVSTDVTDNQVEMLRTELSLLVD